MEVKPQALEWMFSLACDYRFKPSVDNLDPITGSLPDTREFNRALVREARARQSEGLPCRAKRFFDSLSAAFATNASLGGLSFSESDLH